MLIIMTKKKYCGGRFKGNNGCENYFSDNNDNVNVNYYANHIKTNSNCLQASNYN